MNKDNLDISLLNWLSHFLPEQELKDFEETIKSKPSRITDAYKEIFSSYTITSPSELISITVDLTKEKTSYDGLISGIEIPFLSFCKHHFLPFFGFVDVVYEPNDYIIGIGKLSRLVDYRTKRFNIQEYIAKEICEDLLNYAHAKGAYTRVTATHTCLCYRGPKKYNSVNIVDYKIGTCSKKKKLEEIALLFK